MVVTKAAWRFGNPVVVGKSAEALNIGVVWVCCAKHHLAEADEVLNP